MVRDRHLRLLYQDSPCSNQHVTNMNSGSVQTCFSVFCARLTRYHGYSIHMTK